MTFTRCINVSNVNEALPQGLQWLESRGIQEDSRNGSVIVSPDPVITCYADPRRRVLFSPLRDANPFFHLFEGLWMLAGRNDVEWISQFNNRIAQYSDDGKIFHGAYGFRWREYFGYDQLDVIIAELQNNPVTRRAVLTMWDGGCWGEDVTAGDLKMAISGCKDVPCNTSAFFRITNGKLHMMVNCRSNDIIWGAYGANAVHLSMMQEYVASSIGVEVGAFYQNSFNFHAYLDVITLAEFQTLVMDCETHNQYFLQGFEPYPLMQSGREIWDLDLHRFMDGDEDATNYMDPFFINVASPMMAAWKAHKRKDYQMAQVCVAQMMAYDWQYVCRQWLTKRAKNA